MGNALGFVELPNLADAVLTLDIMLKTATVQFVTWEKKLGGRLVTIIVEGEISSVREAVDSALSKSSVNIAAHAVIGNPHPETLKMVALSAKR